MILPEGYASYIFFLFTGWQKALQLKGLIVAVNTEYPFAEPRIHLGQDITTQQVHSFGKVHSGNVSEFSFTSLRVARLHQGPEQIPNYLVSLLSLRHARKKSLQFFFALCNDLQPRLKRGDFLHSYDLPINIYLIAPLNLNPVHLCIGIHR